MDGRLRLTIADNGAGVPEGELAAIFGLFVRSGSGRSPTGYSLGFSITRRVVEVDRGPVTVTNRPGGGLVVVLEC